MGIEQVKEKVIISADTPKVTKGGKGKEGDAGAVGLTLANRGLSMDPRFLASAKAMAERTNNSTMWNILNAYGNGIKEQTSPIKDRTVAKVTPVKPQNAGMKFDTADLYGIS